MTWFFFAITAAFFTTIFNLFCRILAVKSGNPRAFSVLFGFFASFWALGLFLIEPFSFKILSPEILLLTFLATIFYGLNDRFLFYAYNLVEASSLKLIFQLSSVITLIGSAWFLDENLTLGKSGALLLIVAGNALVLHKNSHLHMNRGLVFALSCTVASSLAVITDKKVFSAYPLPLYIMLVYFLPAVYNCLTPPLPIKTLKREWNLAKRWKIPTLALMNLGAYYFMLCAFKYGEASKTYLVLQTSTILVVLSGIIFLKERRHILKKVVATILVFSGALLLT